MKLVRVRRQVSLRMGSRLALKYMALASIMGFSWTLIILASNAGGDTNVYQPMFHMMPYLEPGRYQSNRRVVYINGAVVQAEHANLTEAELPPNTTTVQTKFVPFADDLKKKVIHILLALDKKKLYGLPTFINSVLKSTKTPVRFHILWCQDNSEMVTQYLSCFDIAGFSPHDIDLVEDSGYYMNDVFWEFLKITGDPEKKFRSCSDLVGLKAHRIFHYLDKMIWLDTDMIVQGDLVELWDAELEERWLLAARNQNQYPGSLTYEHMFGRNQYATGAFEAYQARYGRQLMTKTEAFTNDVILLNLERWRKLDMHLEKEYAFWMYVALNASVGYRKQETAGNPWWAYGNQAIMWLTYQQNVALFPYPGWHCDGLGWRLREEITYHKAKNSKLLHWNGGLKPWIDHTSPHIQLYIQQKPSECGGKSTIIESIGPLNANELFFRCDSDIKTDAKLNANNAGMRESMKANNINLINNNNNNYKINSVPKEMNAKLNKSSAGVKPHLRQNKTTTHVINTKNSTPRLKTENNREQKRSLRSVFEDMDRIDIPKETDY